MTVQVAGGRRKAAVVGQVHINGTTGERTLYLDVSKPPWWDGELRRRLRVAVERQVAEQQVDKVMIHTPKGWRQYR